MPASLPSRALTEEFDPERLWNSATGCLQTGLEMAEILAELSLDSCLLCKPPFSTVLFAKVASLWIRCVVNLAVEISGLIDKVLAHGGDQYPE